MPASLASAANTPKPVEGVLDVVNGVETLERAQRGTPYDCFGLGPSASDSEASAAVGVWTMALQRWTEEPP